VKSVLKRDVQPKKTLPEIGGSMGKITQNKRMRNYHEIFEQIYENPVMTIYDISVNTGN